MLYYVIIQLEYCAFPYSGGIRLMLNHCSFDESSLKPESSYNYLFDPIAMYGVVQIMDYE